MPPYLMIPIGEADSCRRFLPGLVVVSNPARDQQPIAPVLVISMEGESPSTAALPPIPEPVHLYEFAHTSHTSSCLSASQISKRQDGI